MSLRLHEPDETDEPEGDELLFEAAKYGDVERVRERLAAGAAVDGRREHRETALMIAADRGHVEIVRMWIERGLDIGGDKCHLNDPLGQAAFGGSVEIVRLLIEAGADVNVKGSDRYPRRGGALVEATVAGHLDIMRLLIEAGADVNAEDSNRNTPSFDWSSTAVIRQEGSGVRYLGADNGGILLEGTTRLQFRTNLTETRRAFVLNALKYLKARSG